MKQGYQITDLLPMAKLRYRANGIEIWRTVCEKPGVVIEQHSHSSDHVSMLSAGSAKVVVDGKEQIVQCPEGVLIRAGERHLFEVLEPGTIIDCIFRISGGGQL